MEKIEPGPKVFIQEMARMTHYVGSALGTPNVFSKLNNLHFLQQLPPDLSQLPPDLGSAPMPFCLPLFKAYHQDSCLLPRIGLHPERPAMQRLKEEELQCALTLQGLL